MEFKTKKQDNATVELIIKFKPDEVNDAYQKAYQKAQKKFKLPGFRAGRVPLDLVEKHLGESVVEEALHELVHSALDEIISDLNPQPISVPRFTEVEQIDRAKGATIKGQYDTFPIIKLGKYRKIKVTEDQPVIKDEHIQKELERLQQERATLMTREGAAQMEDYVQLDIQIRRKDTGKNLYKNQNLNVQLGKTATLPGLDEHLVGMHAEEEKEVDLDIDEDFPDAKFAGNTVTARVKVLDCKFASYPELNDEFAKDVGEYENLAALKSKLRDDMDKEARRALKSRSTQEILNAIVEGSKLIVPDSLIQNEVDRRIEQLGQRLGMKKPTLDDLVRISGENRDKLEADLKAGAQKAVYDQLVVSEISKEIKLEVEQSEIEKEVQERFGQMIPPDQMQRFLQNEELLDDVRSRLLFMKSLDWIYANADVRPGREVAYDELQSESSPS